AGVVWIAVALTRFPGIVRRTPRTWVVRTSIAFGWLGGVVAAVAPLRARDPSVPAAPLLVAVAVAGACAAASRWLRSEPRRLCRPVWLAALVAATFVPALALYPSLLAFSIAAKERLIATEYGPQVLSQRSDLQDLLESALAEIDAQPSLTEFVSEPTGSPRPN